VGGGGDVFRTWAVAIRTTLGSIDFFLSILIPIPVYFNFFDSGSNFDFGSRENIDFIGLSIRIRFDSSAQYLISNKL